MKTFGQIVKNVLMGWGIAAFAVAAASLFNEESVTMRLLRIVLVETALVTAVVFLLFASEKWEAGIWVKRIAASLLSAVIGFTVTVLTGIAKASWLLCAVFGACVVVSFIVFIAADAVERRALERINERLSRNR